MAGEQGDQLMTRIKKRADLLEQRRKTDNCPKDGESLDEFVERMVLAKNVDAMHFLVELIQVLPYRERAQRCHHVAETMRVLAKGHGEGTKNERGNG